MLSPTCKNVRGMPNVCLDENFSAPRLKSVPFFSVPRIEWSGAREPMWCLFALCEPLIYFGAVGKNERE